MGSERSALRWAIGLAMTLAAGAACSSGSSTSAEPTSTVAAGPPTLRLEAPVTGSEPVGPPPDSPVADIRRDCGLSVPLAEGRALWIYCDTVLFTAEEQLEFFVNTSAATADADEPLIMLDVLDRRGEPYPFIEPVPGYPPCTGGEGTFTWPTGAVAVPTDDREQRIIVYFENVCVVPGAPEPYAVGVAELVLDPDQPPTPDERWRATVLEPRVFERPADDAPYGLAAVLHDGDVHVYQCPPSDEPCRVARASTDDVALYEAYEYWDGRVWSDDPATAAPLEMPESFEGTKPAVEWVEALGVFVMANHRVSEPGTVELRVAREPQGPWSAPAELDLPGCAGFYPKICFAAEIHDHLSASDSIGLTWFDPTVDTGTESPTRFAQVPISVAD